MSWAELERLHVSEETVRSRVKHILATLQASDRTRSPSPFAGVSSIDDQEGVHRQEWAIATHEYR